MYINFKQLARVPVIFKLFDQDQEKNQFLQAYSKQPHKDKE
ncbi:MAG: hypothetical protein PHG28_00830 [Rhodoferax sp.]|nr:hypothetical protein [Rhodoferax sp.]